MSLGALRRRIHGNKQTTVTEPGAHDSQISENVREQQELRLALLVQRDRDARTDGKKTLGYFSGPYG